MEEPVRCPTPTPPLTGAGPSPKSPPQSPPSPRRSPPLEREKSASPMAERPPSPEPNCAICLGKSQNKSFTDSCLHQFCFTCLLEWSKVKAECPLCKQSFKSIIHNVRSNEEYDQYHLRPAAENPWTNVMNFMQQRFRYSTTMTADRRLERALEHLEQDLQRRVDPGDVIPPQRTWRRRRGLAPDDFRVNVYNQNLRVTSLPCMGMLRDVSPQNFRNRPEEVHRLIPWLNRELQAILRNPSLSARVLDVVIMQLPRHHMHSQEFRAQLEPYLREHYEHFIHEFYAFARSPYDMIGFDENANYSTRGSLWFELVHEVSSDSSDSDVMVLSQDECQAVPSRNRNRRNQESGSPVPGPSRAVLPVDQASDSDINNISSDTSIVNDDGPERSADPGDSDACMIVGYVKPRHERTPEIITLLSSDTEVEDVTELPQSAHVKTTYDRNLDYVFPSTSSSSPDSESGDSEYVPSSYRKPRKKVQVKKKRKKKPSTATTSRGRSGRRETSRARARRRSYSHSDYGSSECSCTGKKSRRRARSPSTSSSSSCSSGTWRKTPRDRKKKGSWRIQIDMPEVRRNRGYDPPYSPSEINNFLGSSSSSNARPKLRSIVITRAPKEEDTYKDSSSGDRSRSDKRKIQKKTKSESDAGPSGSHHRGSSHSSHSSYRHDGSRYKKHVKKEDKNKRRKRRKDSDSSEERKIAKQRKRIISLFSDTSED